MRRPVGPGLPCLLKGTLRGIGISHHEEPATERPTVLTGAKAQAEVLLRKALEMFRDSRIRRLRVASPEVTCPGRGARCAT